MLSTQCFPHRGLPNRPIKQGGQMWEFAPIQIKAACSAAPRKIASRSATATESRGAKADASAAGAHNHRYRYLATPFRPFGDPGNGVFK